MIIRVERSGGLTGITRFKEVDVNDLPSKLASVVKLKIINSKSSLITPKSAPRGAADYYTYRISVQDGANQKVIECNQFNIRAELKSLIKYIEKHPDAL